MTSQRYRDGAHKKKTSKSPFINESIVSGAAGAVSGAMARFIVGPLDVIKIRFQIQLEPITHGQLSKYASLRQAVATIIKEEGIQGLWRGTIPGQLLAVPYTAVQFLAMQQCKHFAKQMGLENMPAISYVSGAVAGAAGTVASYPFDLLRTTLAAQGEPRVYRGMSDAAKGIVKQYGVQGLYRGLGITILEIMPYAALQFGLYDAFRRALDLSHTENKKTNRSFHSQASVSLQAFFCGLAAGTLAKLGTHPLDVAKKRFQVAGLRRSFRYGKRISDNSVSSLSYCLREIIAKEGVAGLYKGALPSLLKAAPSAAVTFACYDLFFSRFMAVASSKTDKE